MRKRVISSVLCIAVILSGMCFMPGYAAAALTAWVSGFSGGSVLTAEAVCSGMNVTVTGKNTGGFGLEISLAAYSQKDSQSIDTLAAMSQTVSQSGGAFSFTLSFDSRIDDGIILISAENTDEVISARLKIADESGLVENLESMRDEINSLAQKCEAAGIPIDYTKIKSTVIDKFTGFLLEEIDNSDTSRVDYYNTVLTKLYNEARAELLSYLSGDALPKTAPKYLTGGRTIDGSTITANTVRDGVTEERPIFFNGFGHWDYALNNVDVFDDLGFNFLHAEIGPDAVLKHPDAARDWEYICGGFLLEGTKTELSADAYSGSNAMRIVNTTPNDNASFVGIMQKISVQPNTTYRFGFYMKGSSVAAKSYYSIGNSDRKYIGGSYSDYTKKEITYKTGAGETEVYVRIIAEDINPELFIDDVYVKKAFSNVNLISNPGFENGEGDTSGLVNGFKIDYKAIDRLKAGLEKAADNNVAVTLLITPHYFPGFISAEDGTVNSNKTVKTQYMPFNPTHPRVRQTLETYLDVLIPAIRDCAALESIIIANEPAFSPGFNGTAAGIAYYIPVWREFLQNKYSSISALNSKWGTSYGSFSEIDMPAWGNIENADYKNKRSIDYIEFNNSIVYDFHEYMAEKIHSIAPEIKLHTKLMAYLPKTGEYTMNNNLMSGNEYTSLSKLFDINGCDGGISFGIGDSYGFEEMLMWYDFMCSVKDAPVYNTEDHIVGGLNEDGTLNYSEENTNWMVSALWQGALHGRGGTNIWQWNHDQSYINGQYRSSALPIRPMDTLRLGEASLDMNRLSREITALKDKKARVAMLYSDYSNQWANRYRNALYQAYCDCIYSGQKVDFITDYEPEKLNEGDYDLLIAVMPGNVTEETLTQVRQFIGDGGKVLATGTEPFARNKYNEKYPSSMYSDIVSASRCVNYSGTRQYYVYDSYGIVKNAIQDMISEYVRDAGRLQVIDVSSGKQIDTAEVSFAEYNGDTIVNILGLEENTDKTVKIVYDGKEIAASRNMISGELLGKLFTVKPYTPMLLNITSTAESADGRISEVTFGSGFRADGSGAEVTRYNLTGIAEPGYVMATFEVPEGRLSRNTRVRAMIAVYDGEKLVDCTVTYKELSKSGGVVKSAVRVDKTDENTVIKAFLWDEFLNPLCDVKKAVNTGGTTK